MTDLPVRDIARALVLDPENRLLLIAYEAARDADPAQPGVRQVWVLPGGGVEPGETHEEALKRELEEEIGVTDITIGPWVGRCEGPFLSSGSRASPASATRSSAWPTTASTRPASLRARTIPCSACAGGPCPISTRPPMSSSRTGLPDWCAGS